jgi:hypothetical protein
MTGCLSRLVEDKDVRVKSLRHGDRWGVGKRIRQDNSPPLLVSLFWSDA